MQKIYLFGSGGFAREVCFLIQEINKVKPTFELAGFIDINIQSQKIRVGSMEIEVFDETAFFKNSISEEEYFAMGVGNPKILNSIKNKYSSRIKFPNLIHPNVTGLFETISLGSGNIITSGCVFTVDITVGDFNIFNLNSTIGHDAVIGNCNVMNPGANISGGVYIGNGNLIGTNAAILQNIRIGNNNAVGAGAVVTSNMEDNIVAVGVPAKEIKRNI